MSRFVRLILFCVISLCWFGSLRGEDVRLSQPPTPIGRRILRFDTWNQMVFHIQNRSESDAEFVVASFFDDEPQQQYGARVWVPAKSTRGGWFLLKTPPAKNPLEDVEPKDFQTLVLGGDGSNEVAVASDNDRRLHSGYVRNAKWSSPVLLISDPADTTNVKVAEIFALLRKQDAHLLRQGDFPYSAMAYDGLQTVILASERIGSSSRALEALREWVYGGGTLWIQLEKTGEGVANALLSDDASVSVVDKLELMRTEIEQAPGSTLIYPRKRIDLEKPLPVWRVVSHGLDPLIHFDDWPAFFVQRHGRGAVFLTTFDGEILFEQQSFQERAQIQPVRPTLLGQILRDEIQPSNDLKESEESRWPEFARQYIGYQVTSKATVFTILALFCLFIMVLGVWSWMTHDFARAFWIAPGIAILTTTALLVVGSQSRATVKSPHAQVQFAMVDREGQTRIQGGRAVFRLSADQDEIVLNEDGSLSFSDELRGAPARALRTDENLQVWNNLNLPSGPETSELVVYRERAPVQAEFTLNRDGLIGQIQGGGVDDFREGMLLFPSGSRSNLRRDPQGRLLSTSEDVLAEGEYLAQAILDQRGQWKRDLMQSVLSGSQRFPQTIQAFYWGAPIPLDFGSDPPEDVVGDVLFQIPVELKRPAPGTEFALPSPLLYFESIPHPSWGASTVYRNRDRTWTETTIPESRTTLRVSLPRELAPLEISSLAIRLDLRVPQREVKIFTVSEEFEDRLLTTLDSPVGQFDLELVSSDELRGDPDNIVTLLIHVGSVPDLEDLNPNTTSWQIERFSIQGRAKSL
ncbi:MAG: hypothetical protein KDA80_01330 [Planctomycetaceae bacterium]|nr:hypothetical protein [Planctomycetaceae bacterium]